MKSKRESLPLKTMDEEGKKRHPRVEGAVQELVPEKGTKAN